MHTTRISIDVKSAMRCGKPGITTYFGAHYVQYGRTLGPRRWTCRLITRSRLLVGSRSKGYCRKTCWRSIKPGCNIYEQLWTRMCSMAGRGDVHPFLECFEDMVLVIVLKSTQARGKSAEVLEAVMQRWSQVIDFEYLQDKGIEMAMNNRVLMNRCAVMDCGNETSTKKRRAM